MIRPIRATVRMAAFLAVTVVLVPIQLVYMLVVSNPVHQSPIVRLWFKAVRRILGISVSLIGADDPSHRPVLYLGNHISYLDIIVLGDLLDCFFVAKSEVANWPFFGFLSKVGGTLFISRKKSAVRDQIPLLLGHIEHRKSLYLFPEGTTSNGMQVLDFKTGLLNVLSHVTDDARPPIRPVTLVYTHLNGTAIHRQTDMDCVAWYADMTLLPHLWNVFGQKSIKAVVVLHPCFIVDTDIKTVAARAQNNVRQSFDTILSNTSQ